MGSAAKPESRIKVTVLSDRTTQQDARGNATPSAATLLRALGLPILSSLTFYIHPDGRASEPAPSCSLVSLLPTVMLLLLCLL